MFNLVNFDFAFFGIYLALSLYFYFKEDNTRPLIYSFTAIFLAAILKPILNIQRPCYNLFMCPDFYGFPSGHTLLALMFALSLKNKRRFLFILIALIIAYSRYALGLHTLGQLIGTTILGIIIWKILLFFEQRYCLRRS